MVVDLGSVFLLFVYLLLSSGLGMSSDGHSTGQGCLYWFPPVLTFSVLVGLSLDYDIFLLTRVAEYHSVGMSTNDAILFGLCKTGNIINAAGIIMAIAFSGLLFSAIPTMNQMSCYMVFAVLFDTFVVRPILVPAIMSLLGETNWWPLNWIEARQKAKAENTPLGDDQGPSVQ
eukprot:gene11893-2169_t